MELYGVSKDQIFLFNNGEDYESYNIFGAHKVQHDGKDGVFRTIVVDDMVVGNISIEQKADVYCRDAEIGYLLLTEFWSKGIMTEAVRLICEIAFAELDLCYDVMILSSLENVSRPTRKNVDI